MAHAEVCPICRGTGKYLDRTCHGCDGRGWVVVNDIYPVIPYNPPIEYPEYYPWYEFHRFQC